MEQLTEYILRSFPPAVAITLLILLYYRDSLISFLQSGTFSPKANLLNHDLFQLINRVKSVKIGTIQFIDDETKTKVFRDFLTIKMEVIDRQITSFIEDNNIKKASQDELESKLKLLITNIVVEYNKLARERFIEQGMTIEQAEHVLSIFDKWNADTIDAVYSRVDNVVSSTYYRTNYSKLVATMEILAVAVELTISDGVRSFNELNGYFKQISYGTKSN